MPAASKSFEDHVATLATKEFAGDKAKARVAILTNQAKHPKEYASYLDFRKSFERTDNRNQGLSAQEIQDRTTREGKALVTHKLAMAGISRNMDSIAERSAGKAVQKALAALTKPNPAAKVTKPPEKPRRAETPKLEKHGYKTYHRYCSGGGLWGQ